MLLNELSNQEMINPDEFMGRKRIIKLRKIRLQLQRDNYNSPV